MDLDDIKSLLVLLAIPVMGGLVAYIVTVLLG